MTDLGGTDLGGLFLAVFVALTAAVVLSASFPSQIQSYLRGLRPLKAAAIAAVAGIAAGVISTPSTRALGPGFVGVVWALAVFTILDALRGLHTRHFILLASSGVIAAASNPSSLSTWMIAGFAALGILLVRIWIQEFTALMSEPDDAFPGRFDKPIWAILLVVVPPIGVLALRSHREAHEAPAKPVVGAAARDFS